MSGFARSRQAAALGVALAACASCSHRVANVAVVPQAAPIVEPRPVLPAELGAIVPPPRAADGGYQTINHGIDAKQTMWHVRAALNVAAIGCRSAADAGLVSAYNMLLKGQKAALASADAAVKADFHKRLGTGWQNAHDAYMTQLYNFFAQPAAKARFCTAADTVAAEAAAVPADGFESFAQTALPQLEAPFIANFRAVDDYHVALAQWTAKQNGAAETELAATSGNHPQLSYAAMPALLAWQPDTTTRIASR